VQGYSTCAHIWAADFAQQAGHPSGANAWEKWWKINDDGKHPRHLYFLGKDNIPFHTVIWPALIMGLNHANAGLDHSTPVTLPKAGQLALEYNVPAMEYLMLAGGQFSKSRKHAVWLPSFLERYDADTLRYYLSINMPENHDTDFNWPDFVEKINSELIAAYGNFVHRILTLGSRLTSGANGPFESLENSDVTSKHKEKLESMYLEISSSLNKHRFKEALRTAMKAAQYGNQIIQAATPWKYLSEDEQSSVEAKESLATLAFGWRICRFLSIVMQPFMPFSSQKLWHSLGQPGDVSQVNWSEAINWNSQMTWNNDKPEPLFKRLDLEEILEHEQSLASGSESDDKEATHAVKGGKKGGKKM
ncbi:MAG: class I tRNA ligase family protein, partial [Candidatus Thermoplasmatota archaeon]|nr:class I tRNA ligase family protein [Candidatus Thermoplasmatota archaeon]